MPPAMKPPRRRIAPRTPQKSTRGWNVGGMVKTRKSRRKTKRFVDGERLLEGVAGEELRGGGWALLVEDPGGEEQRDRDPQ